VPSPLSATVPIEPRLGERPKVIVPPETVRFWLDAFFSCTESVLVALPSAVTLVGLADTVLVARSPPGL